MNQHANQPEPLTPARLYAVIVLGTAFMFGTWLFLQGLLLESWLVPLLAVLVVVTRHQWALIALVGVTFCVIGLYPDYWTPTFSTSIDFLEGALCVPLLMMMAAAFRYYCLSSSVFPAPMPTFREIVRRLLFWRARGGNQRRGAGSFPLAEIGWLACAVMASFGLATYWLYQLPTERAETLRYGLLPFGVRVVQLLLAMFLLVTVAHGLLCYLRWRKFQRLESSIQLRHELWREARGEFALVSRHRGKSRRRLRRAKRSIQTK